MADLGAIGISRSPTRYCKSIGRDTTVRTLSGACRARTVSFTTTPKLVIGVKAVAIAYSDTACSVHRTFKRIPWWTSDPRPLHSIPTTASLSGSVKKEGAIARGVPVHLYYHKNGAKIETVISDSLGVFTFKYLDPSDFYFVVATDSSYPPSAYNAQIYDFVNPV